ncbi:hypothetical protein Aph01nite_50490 [Acrocarpospora phusangensis]|uniref:Uncharacterized protein n=1 Tax=Acrocarpospora phusangensis TaxID=1070424 RepID=A0A919QFA1_9ACTN|nr:hypothetical protein Aph01nite_50490 [Acrocarpospora phusangensis]
MLWALTSPDVCSLLVVRPGWPGDAYQDWLAATITGIAGSGSDPGLVARGGAGGR